MLSEPAVRDRRDVLFTNSIIILSTIGAILVLFLLLVALFFVINKRRQLQMDFYEIPDSGKPSISLKGRWRGAGARRVAH